MRLPSAMPARVATVVMSVPKPWPRRPGTTPTPWMRGHAVALREARHGHRLVAEPDDPGAQPAGLQRRQQAGAAALGLGRVDAEDAALEQLVGGQRARLHGLDAEPRVEVRHDRGVAHPEHGLAQDAAPSPVAPAHGPGPAAGRGDRTTAAMARRRRRASAR